MTGRYQQAQVVPWYHPENYESARLQMADRENLPTNYADWLSKAEAREAAIRLSGKYPVRVPVDDQKFTKYCSEKSLALDGKARMRYANDRVREYLKPNIIDYEHVGFWPGAKSPKEQAPEVYVDASYRQGPQRR